MTVQGLVTNKPRPSSLTITGVLLGTFLPLSIVLCDCQQFPVHSFLHHVGGEPQKDHPVGSSGFYCAVLLGDSGKYLSLSGLYL
jgi:hypothetical protein